MKKRTFAEIEESLTELAENPQIGPVSAEEAEDVQTMLKVVNHMTELLCHFAKVLVPGQLTADFAKETCLQHVRSEDGTQGSGS